MGEWQNYRLADICTEPGGIQTGPFGSQLHKKDYVEQGTPIITVEHLEDNRITSQNLPMVSDKDRRRLAKYSLREGDIVFSRVGSVDRRALVRKREEGWLFSGRCLRVRVNREIANPSFISYLFGTESFKEHIRSIAVGATMPSINTKILSNVNVLLPPIHDQNEIASILGALDDKIELNRQTNETLEALARAIFKDWFVDFGPTRAKAEGQLSYLAPDLWALFPDALDDEDKPVGWEIGKLGDIVRLRSERCQASPEIEEKLYVPIDCISQRSLLLCESKPGSEAKSSLTRFYEGDILFGAMRPYFHKVCIAPFDGTTRTTVFVFSPILEMDYAFSVLLLHDAGTIDYATSHSTGSTIPYAVWSGSLDEMPVCIPAEPLRYAFNELLEPLLSQIPKRYFENLTLTQTRDLLLPKLMSGEIRLRDAEKLVEDVA